MSDTVPLGKKEKLNVVAAEVAEAEFDRFAEEMDLDVDTSVMDAEDLTEFNKIKRRIIREIERGNLVINEDGEAIYTPQNPRSRTKEPIHFHERSGATVIASDSKKQTQMAGKGFAMMADLCQVPAKTFAGLFGTDIKVCEALFALLMD
jgi:hypothetical protein